MQLPLLAVLLGFFVRGSLGASLGVIDQDRQCLIWSNGNHGCTGYSEPFAELNGTDCSGTTQINVNYLSPHIDPFRGAERDGEWHTQGLHYSRCRSVWN
jgi:hypothetical protein